MKSYDNVKRFLILVLLTPPKTRLHPFIFAEEDNYGFLFEESFADSADCCGCSTHSLIESKARRSKDYFPFAK